jgi:transposase
MDTRSQQTAVGMLNVVCFGSQVKILYFDRSGWALWAKRLEAGSFIRNWSDMRSGEIDCTALKLMLEGMEVKRQFKRYELRREG